MAKVPKPHGPKLQFTTHSNLIPESLHCSFLVVAYRLFPCVKPLNIHLQKLLCSKDLPPKFPFF
uniref:Uncharacterized protein n=1 Tax=Helianthus annuus TaxID=4232 RepID=A0A251SQR6_HELAN